MADAPTPPAPQARTRTAAGRAELLNRKRRVLSEYLNAGETLLKALLGDPDVEEVPMAEDIAPLLERRDLAIEDIRRIDQRLIDALPHQDPASEIVAENALRRALESSADLDQAIADALTTWQARLTAALADIAAGRKTLRGYRTATNADARTTTAPKVVDEAA